MLLRDFNYPDIDWDAYSDSWYYVASQEIW